LRTVYPEPIAFIYPLYPLR